MTRASGSISIIVPVFNEAGTVQALQEQLRPLLDECDVIFVDGGSTDGTPALIERPFSLISCEKGRGRQLNEGALRSTGDILLFLHCDSVLPNRPLEEIRRVMAHHRFGCFGIRFDRPSPVLALCQAASNARVIFRGIAYGDQGMFIERSLFFETGMFPDIPLMEDYQLSLTLRGKGIQPGLARKRITTSSRRFPKSIAGQISTWLHMTQLRRCYRGGISPTAIARAYGDRR